MPRLLPIRSHSGRHLPQLGSAHLVGGRTVPVYDRPHVPGRHSPGHVLVLLLEPTSLRLARHQRRLHRGAWPRRPRHRDRHQHRQHHQGLQRLARR